MSTPRRPPLPDPTKHFDGDPWWVRLAALAVIRASTVVLILAPLGALARLKGLM